MTNAALRGHRFKQVIPLGVISNIWQARHQCNIAGITLAVQLMLKLKADEMQRSESTRIDMTQTWGFNENGREPGAARPRDNAKSRD
jgi:hypothetical protein